MKTAHYDEITKQLLGWYDKDIHTTIPAPNIKVNNDTWLESININANYVDATNKKLSVKDFRTDAEMLLDLKVTKLTQIESDFNIAESQLITVNSIVYQGGRDSVEAIDSYVRLRRLNGLNTHFIWDYQGTETELTDIQADAVLIAIGNASSTNKFTKKNRKVAVAVATTIAEVEAV